MGWLWKRNNAEKERKEQSIDYSSLFTSMGQGRQLFDQLKVRCHPDRFVGTDKQSLAEELFKQIQANCTNYKTLLFLKERVDSELY